MTISLPVVVLVILVVLVVLALPRWPYSAGWGYAPSAALTVVLVICLVLLLMGGHL